MFGAGYGGYGGGNWGPGYGGGGPMNPYGGGGYGWGGYYGPVTTGILDDSEIASYVRDNIDLDPYISVNDKNNIDVDVEGGSVHLKGTVRSRRSKGLAYADAFWTAGVLDVQNDLEVTEEQPEQRQPQPGGQPGMGRVRG